MRNLSKFHPSFTPAFTPALPHIPCVRGASALAKPAQELSVMRLQPWQPYLATVAGWMDLYGVDGR
jgi:hypothetical protein